MEGGQTVPGFKECRVGGKVGCWERRVGEKDGVLCGSVGWMGKVGV